MNTEVKIRYHEKELSKLKRMKSFKERTEIYRQYQIALKLFDYLLNTKKINL